MLPAQPLSPAPDSALGRWPARHPVAAYFGLAYAFSWAVELPLVAAAQGWVRWSVPPTLHYLAAFGPLLAALVVVSATEGRAGVRRWLAGLLRWRVGWVSWLGAIGLPLALFGVAAVVNYVTTGQALNLALLGQVDYLPDLTPLGALGLWLLTFGLGEELGWRGLALPRLQRSHSALTASLLLGVVWAFWHLPAFFYKDTYMAMGLAGGLPMLVLSITAAALVFTWLYNTSGGSLLVVIVFHALFDFLSVTPAGGDAAPALMSAGVMIWAVLIVIFFRPAQLARQGKHTG